MINRFEATGIFASIALMAIALFLLNMSSATRELANNSNGNTATVVLSEDDLGTTLSNSVDKKGQIEQLIIDDVVVGSGVSVAAGDTVSVHYIGTLTNGQQFDSSYVKGEPFTFTVGEGEVIAGWDQGILGMKTGGQRILVIPSEQAYGEAKVGPIPPNSTLVFAIELLSINR